MEDVQVMLKAYEETSNQCIELMKCQKSYIDLVKPIYEAITKSLVENGISKGDVDAICSANDVKMILYDVEQLSAAGYDVEKEVAVLYKLHETMFRNVPGFENLGKYKTSDLVFYQNIQSLLKKLESIQIMCC